MLSSVKGSSVLWDGFVLHATCRVSSSSGAQPKTLGLSTREPGLAPHKPLKPQHSVSKGGLTNTEHVSRFGSALSVLPLCAEDPRPALALLPGVLPLTWNLQRLLAQETHMPGMRWHGTMQLPAKDSCIINDFCRFCYKMLHGFGASFLKMNGSAVKI